MTNAATGSERGAGVPERLDERLGAIALGQSGAVQIEQLKESALRVDEREHAQVLQVADPDLAAQPGPLRVPDLAERDQHLARRLPGPGAGGSGPLQQFLRAFTVGAFTVVGRSR